MNENLNNKQSNNNKIKRDEIELNGTVKNNIENLYNQYWEHARHQETQRLEFANFYVIIIAALFTFPTIFQFDILFLLLTFFFGFVLSLLGFWITYAWNIPFVEYTRRAELIAICEWRIEKKYRRFFTYKKLLGAGDSFMIFYSLMISAFSTINTILIVGILKNLTLEETIAGQSHLVFTILPIFGLILILYFGYLKAQSIKKIDKQFRKLAESCENEIRHE